MCLSPGPRLRAARIVSLKTQIASLARWMQTSASRGCDLEGSCKTAPSTQNRGLFTSVTTFRMKSVDVSNLYFNELLTTYGRTGLRSSGCDSKNDALTH